MLNFPGPAEEYFFLKNHTNKRAIITIIVQPITFPVEAFSISTHSPKQQYPSLVLILFPEQTSF